MEIVFDRYHKIVITFKASTLLSEVRLSIAQIDFAFALTLKEEVSASEGSLCSGHRSLQAEAASPVYPDEYKPL